MNRLLQLLAALVFAAFAAPVLAVLNVFASVPEWGALAEELGGEQVKVYTATNALQDPHHIEARPSLIARARTADLVVATGAELEVGWLPLVLQQSGNARVQPGKAGYFEAAQYVRMLDKPARLDRADGDVHPGGNPHIQTDPRNIALVAEPLARRLAELDPANASVYQARSADFLARWKVAIQRWDKEAAPLRGVPVVVQHKAFPYLQQWLGLMEVAVLEPKPGVEPTSAHLSAVLAGLQAKPAKMILRAAYNDGRGAEWLADRTKLPVVVLPFTVGGNEQAKDLFSLFDDTVQRLLKGAR